MSVIRLAAAREVATAPDIVDSVARSSDATPTRRAFPRRSNGSSGGDAHWNVGDRLFRTPTNLPGSPADDREAQRDGRPPSNVAHSTAIGSREPKRKETRRSDSACPQGRAVKPVFLTNQGGTRSRLFEQLREGAKASHLLRMLRRGRRPSCQPPAMIASTERDEAERCWVTRPSREAGSPPANWPDPEWGPGLSLLGGTLIAAPISHPGRSKEGRRRVRTTRPTIASGFGINWTGADGGTGQPGVAGFGLTLNLGTCWPRLGIALARALAPHATSREVGGLRWDSDPPDDTRQGAVG